ncbi:hypothetical protein PsorP6_001005 [Peronosclerospora sorghi]|uniref:Uncharacterized protein n=1 Tax=Peronosclerospora sorghi TaxID=230839 RepID=A0ACC0WSH0_9STRA|nr:hypothetical protein PsorP6_001005 [Peronosclerospora sorghi]
MPSTALITPLSITEQPTYPPAYNSPVGSDESIENDCQLLLTILGHPETDCSSSHVSTRRGVHSFPYTRSKTRWRKRPNDELKYLRSQIQELEKTVASLSSGRKAEPKLLRNGPQAKAEKGTSKIDAALAENRKLKAMVQTQFQVAKDLRAALDESMRLRARTLCWPSSAAASDELVFALLDEEKELQYAATDKVLDKSGIARIYHPYLSDMVFQHDENGLCFLHNDVRVLPFPVAAVATSLRRSLTHGGRVGPSQHCRKFLMRDDSFSQAVTVDQVDMPGNVPAIVKGRHLLWSVDRQDRTVINWSSFNEYRKGSNHIRLLKRLWFSIEPIHLETSGTHPSENAQGSIIRTIVRLTPVDPEVDLKVVEDLSDVIIAGYKRDSVRVVLAVRDQLAAFARRGGR